MITEALPALPDQLTDMVRHGTTSQGKQCYRSVRGPTANAHGASVEDQNGSHTTLRNVVSITGGNNPGDARLPPTYTESRENCVPGI
jgi:hypothetical protein